MPSAVVLGGGLSGIAAAVSLARAGWGKVTIVERGDTLGGLAATFKSGGHYYPLSYHHILHLDRPLLYFLDQIGTLPRVRWRRIRMLFHLADRLFDLARPMDFLRFPMSVADKMRFVAMMRRAFRTDDWSDWEGRSARELVDSWAGPGVTEAIFERLSRLKFGLPSDQVSGAWLGARLSFREGSSALGYIPGSNWTKDLCDGLTALLDHEGVEVRLGAVGRVLHGGSGRIDELELGDGERLRADVLVSTVPTEIYCRMVHDDTPYLGSIRFTAVISAICATRQRIEPDFYWMNMLSLDQQSCGIFRLSSLNPTIGDSGDTCLNFVTHLTSRHEDLYKRTDEELWDGYRVDFRGIFGFELDPRWTHLTRLPMYSPLLLCDYRNPQLRSATWRNVYFAGNYRTFPSTVTTGTALRSGLEAGRAVLRDHGGDSSMLSDADAFRFDERPRA